VEKKRSVGVTIFACFFIIGGILTIIGIVKPKNASLHIQRGMPSIILGYISAIFDLICGIYLLKLKSWARKLAIILGAAHLIPMLLFLKIAGPINTEVMKSTMVARGYTQMQQKQFDSFASTVLMIVVAIGIIWNLSIIYFFTRPKVKEQFN
jgi:hypothetical protein